MNCQFTGPFVKISDGNYIREEAISVVYIEKADPGDDGYVHDRKDWKVLIDTVTGDQYTVGFKTEQEAANEASRIAEIAG